MEAAAPLVKTRDGKWIKFYNGVGLGPGGYKFGQYSTGQVSPEFPPDKVTIAHYHSRCSLIWRIVLAVHQLLDSKCRSFSLSTLKDKSAMCSSVRDLSSSVASGSCTSVKAMRIWGPQQRQCSHKQSKKHIPALLLHPQSVAILASGAELLGPQGFVSADHFEVQDSLRRGLQ